MPRFCALFSSSSGNCTYIESDNSAILIDAGVSCRAICNALTEIGSSIEKIKAIFITHEHTDHTKGLKTMLSKYDIKVYATCGTIKGISSSLSIDVSKFCEMPLLSEVSVDDIKVHSFKTSHDSNESCGYISIIGDKKLSVVTDLGFIDDGILEIVEGSDLIMIESNHDIGMLQNGRYPYFLKRRILSDKGHLSNESCAKVLPELVKNGTHKFVLAHLSKDNNIPELALETAVSTLKLSGISEDEYEICVAPRSGPKEVFTF